MLIYHLSGRMLVHLLLSETMDIGSELVAWRVRSTDWIQIHISERELYMLNANQTHL